MKYLSCFCCLIVWLLTAKAQPTPQTPSLPNSYNQFITAPNITWAAELRDYFSFSDAQPINGANVYDYLFKKAEDGKLKIATSNLADFITFNRAQKKAQANKKATPLPAFDPTALDAQKSIALHEIFYIQNNRLHSYILAASPLVNVITSTGVNLGMNNCFYCCGATNPSMAAPDKGMVLLQTITRTINPDSMSDFKSLKQSFGMNLAQVLWYGASKNSGSMTDMIAAKKIAFNEVMTYTFGGRVSVPLYDSTGNIITYRDIMGPPPFEEDLQNKIELVQDIYFNPQLNKFASVVRECYFFVRIWDSNISSYRYEKRFKLAFHNATKKNRLN
jgi:hypothetical protein